MIRPNAPLWATLEANGLDNYPPALNLAAILAWSAGDINVCDHLQSYLALIPCPIEGPYEMHPYIHREGEEFDLRRKYLLLGTFPPNSYLRNTALLAAMAGAHPNVGAVPNIDFYYGNMANLWKFFGLAEPLTIDGIKQFLQDHSIAISDVILGAQRNIFASAADSDLFNILPNQGLCSIVSENNLETILFTSGSLHSLLVDQNQVTTLKVFVKILTGYCEFNCHNGCTISGHPDGSGPFHPFTPVGIAAAVEQQKMRINDGLLIPDNYKHIVWYLKFPNKTLRVINLPTPRNTQAHMSSNFFYRWLRWKCEILGLPIPPDQNRQGFMNQFPQHFPGAPSNLFRKDIYQIAINNLPQLLAL